MTRRLIIVALVVATALTAATAAVADERSSADDLRINVVTVGKGDALFSRFGHISLMVENRRRRTAKVYNFGTFDFADPNLRTKYARGFLEYWLSVSSFAGEVRRYRYYDREMVVRTLDLTSAQAAAIAERLEINARPENRTYAYRHYLDNCCTRIRDILDDALDGAVSRGRDAKPTGRTFRYWTERALEGLPVMQSIILFSLGPAIDQPITRWDEQFLPEVLVEDLDQIRIGANQRPLVKRKRTVIARRAPPPEELVPTMDLVLIGVIAGLLLIGLGAPLWLGRRPAAARLGGFGLFVWGLLCGAGGLLLTLFWTITQHTDTHFNENLLVWPVLHLWLIGPGLKLIFKARLRPRTARLLGWYLIGALGLVALDLLLKVGPFIQGNWGPIALAVICDGAALLALRRAGVVPPLRRRP